MKIKKTQNPKPTKQPNHQTCLIVRDTRLYSGTCKFLPKDEHYRWLFREGHTVVLLRSSPSNRPSLFSSHLNISY